MFQLLLGEAWWLKAARGSLRYMQVAKVVDLLIEVVHFDVCSCDRKAWSTIVWELYLTRDGGRFV